MGKAKVWTLQTDFKIKAMRAGGDTWDAIAAAVGVSRYTAIERGRRIGAVYVPGPVVALPNPNRDPLPAGDCISWGAITRGTPLDGSAYTPPASPR